MPRNIGFRIQDSVRQPTDRARNSSRALALVCIFFCSSLATHHSSLLFSQVPAGTPVYNVNAKWVTDRGSQVYNVMAYGAKCDDQYVIDGAMTQGSAVMTSGSNKFAAGDVGKYISVAGAGASGGTLVTTIASYQSAGQVTLSASASTGVSGTYVEWATDDAPAIQTAMNTANPDVRPNAGMTYSGNGVILIPGGCAIGSTLMLKGILEGTGTPWTQAKNGSHSYLKALAPLAGQPMVRNNTWFNAVRDLSFIGSSSFPPSEAILIDDSAAGTGNFASQGEIRNISIGPVGLVGPDTGKQFVNGISWSGGPGGGDSWLMDHIWINNCSNYGVNSVGASVTWDFLEVAGCAVGFAQYGNETFGLNWEFSGNAIDIEMFDNSTLNVRGFVSTSGSIQMVVNTNGKLVIDGGSFYEANGSSNVTIIDNSNNPGGYTILKNFTYHINSGFTGNPILQNCTSTGLPGDLRLINTSGFTPSMISCQQNWANGLPMGGVIDFQPLDSRGWGSYHADALNVLSQYSGYSFDSTRHDLERQYYYWGGPLEVIQVPGTLIQSSCTPTGTGSTTYGYRITAVTGQTFGITSGGLTGVNIGGETTPNTEVTCSNASPLSSTNYNTIALQPVIGASGYNIYCRTPGAELLCATLPSLSTTGAFTWVDNGSVTPSGAMPTANTTGRIVGGSLGSNWAFTENLDIGADGHGYFASLRDAGLRNVPVLGTDGSGNLIQSTSGTVTVASGQLALTYGSAIASGACDTVQSVAAGGVLASDTIKFTPASDPTGVTGWGVSGAGAVLSLFAYPTAGYVNFRECNSTQNSITPGALTINWEVTR